MSKKNNEYLQEISEAARTSVSGLAIPDADYVEFTYYGSTNNLETQVFKVGGSGGDTVATLTYDYAGGAVSDDDVLTSITKT